MDAPASAYSREIVGLSEPTRVLLAAGARYWSDDGPAGLDDELLALMNVRDPVGFRGRLSTLALALRRNEPVSVVDLTRALLLTEIGWASAVIGPTDWANMYGYDDDAWDASQRAALRRAQDELIRSGVPASGTDPFGKHPLPG